MSSLPATLHPLNPWTIFVSTSSAAPARRRHLCSFGGNFPEHGRRKSAIPSPTCNAASNARVIQDVWPNNFSILDRTQVLLDAVKEECQEPILKVAQLDEVGSRVKAIKEVLGSLEDGKISPSAYDTAWVALVRDAHGSGAPQFPSALEWVVDNQHPDGSWGDPIIFLAHDRIISTLACVIALKSWDVQPQLCEKGLSFLRKNMAKLEEEDHEHMPIGFEVVFPSLMEIARCLNLNLPFDAPYLQEIYARRELKLGKIPKEIFHQVPTPLLHSLEGIPDLDWEKMLKLQGPEGSFLFSPSATAFALIETGNEKCFEYIQRIVERFNGGVPNVYPVDLFEHLWAVDRIQRLGISRHFQTEIRSCLEYVHRYWSEDGICWARNSPVMDVDDTAMAFRLLRLNGFDISPDAFRNFEKEGTFFCLAGQSNQAVTGMFNLYRASQVSFPGEKILEDARTFSRGFLREKQIAKQLLDKWIIASDLPGEVNYALDFPWYASLPRIETRFYLGHYGGEQDVWIGKTLYRMPCVSNNEYLELAKLDFIKCQRMYQLEWVEVRKWYNECGLEEMGLSERAVLHAYFVAAASIFEPERAAERLAWTRTAALIEVFRSHIGNSSDLKQTVLDFVNTRAGSSKVTNGLTRALQHTLRLQSWEVLLAHGRDVRHHIRQAWEQWLRGWQEEDEDAPRDAELLVRAINLCAGRPITDDISSRPTYHYLSSRTSHVCSELRNLRESKVLVYNGGLTVGRYLTEQDHSQLIDDKMQEIAQAVLCRTDDLALDTKQTFLTVAKGFYYMAHCSPANLNQHIAKVLFERVA